MNFAKIRRNTALAVLGLLLMGTPSFGLFVKKTGTWETQEWIHAIALSQTVLLAACVVYGPGKFFARIPFAAAWGLAIGFGLARLNLFSGPGRSSLSAGATLVVTGTLSPLIVFALHRWSTGARLTFGAQTEHDVAKPAFQLSLQMLFLVTTAFAAVGVLARLAIIGTDGSFADDHDNLVLLAWLAFLPCLTAAPAFLAVFRPSWRIVLAGLFYVFVAVMDPILLGLAAPHIFVDPANTLPQTTWNYSLESSIDELIAYGKVLLMAVIYALLARAAGFQMLVVRQSRDKNPNPSAQPATDAGCVQD